MKYRRLLLGGFLAMGLAVTTASGALAEQIVAVNSPVESVGGQATKVTDAGQNAADTSQATVNSSVNTDTTQSAAGNTQTDTARIQRLLLQNQIRHPSPRPLPVSAFISANVRAS
mgnify:CR=1 FL=1